MTKRVVLRSGVRKCERLYCRFRRSRVKKCEEAYGCPRDSEVVESMRT